VPEPASVAPAFLGVDGWLIASTYGYTSNIHGIDQPEEASLNNELV
jgi:hypothetical protein